VSACSVARPEFLHRLTDIAWDYAALLHDGMLLAQELYCDFKAID